MTKWITHVVVAAFVASASCKRTIMSKLMSSRPDNDRLIKV